MTKLFRLLLTLLFVLGLAVTAFAQEEIDIGDSVDGEADDEVVEYEIDLEEGQAVAINVESDDFDTYLTLFDEDGDEVASDDDGGGGLNSRIVYTAEQDGTYTIAVGAFPTGAPADGDFELSVEGVEAVEAEEIELGDNIDGEADNQLREYLIELEEDQTVEINVESDDFDTYLTLFNEDGDEVASDDDGGDGLNSRIVYTVEEDGTYTIAVGSFPSGSPADGDFELDVDEIEVEILDAFELAYGDELEVDVEDAMSAEFVFEGEEGDVITIYARSDADQDLRMVLLDPDGDEVAVYDSFGNPSITRFELEDDGEYVISITEYDGAVLDDEIEIELLESEILDLAEGPQTVELDENVQIDYMVFEAEEDVVYIMTIELSDSTDSTLYIDLLEEDAFFAETRASVAGVSEAAMVFEVSDDGLLRVELEFFSFGEDVEVTVSIDVLE